MPSSFPCLHQNYVVLANKKVSQKELRIRFIFISKFAALWTQIYIKILLHAYFFTLSVDLSIYPPITPSLSLLFRYAIQYAIFTGLLCIYSYRVRFSSYNEWYRYFYDRLYRYNDKIPPTVIIIIITNTNIISPSS